MHLRNLSAVLISHSLCSSQKVVDRVPSPFIGLYVRPTGTDVPNIPKIPTIESSSEIYPPDTLVTIPDRHHVLTGSPSTYVLLAKLGQGVHGKVFAAHLIDDPDDKIYSLKTIPKASVVQRAAAEVTKELWVLRFITDASLSNKPFPFIQKLKENFQDEENLYIVLEYFPVTLAHTETALPFRLSQKTNPPGLSLSPSKAHQSKQEAIQALRFLVAELTLGLLFLHRHGIVHQDIKPANVMISKWGHAVIGEFGAASALPIPSQPGGGPFERCSLSRIDKDDEAYGSIVLQPEDTVTFTPLYAAPELMERKRNGLLVYDERADWWSLGVSLYEITTGGTPFHISSDAASIGKGRRGGGENGLCFDLLEELNPTGRYDAHLDEYLRSLLVHEPNHRLSGERAKSHPFLEPLRDIWVEIEDLRHPPCPNPSARVLRGDIDLSESFNHQEDSSKFDAQCTQISFSSPIPESPQSPLYEEYHTPRETFSNPEQNSLESPSPLTRRTEALAFKRSGGQALLYDNTIDFNGLQESGSSVILQQEAFMSYYIESSFQTNGKLSAGNPFPSTASVGRFFSDERFYGMCSTPRGSVGIPEESMDDEIVRAEISFADSGLDFPLGSSPESWGQRKSDLFKKPLALRPMYGPGFQGIVKDGEGRMHDEIVAKPNMTDVSKPSWTFDEKITISLLQASMMEQETSEPTVRSRFSKPQVVAAPSEGIIKAAGRRVADTLRRRRRLN